MNSPSSTPRRETRSRCWSILTKSVSALLVLFLGLVLPLFYSLPVSGAVNIVALDPATGPIATAVSLTGTINTNNGGYEIHWDSSPGTILRAGTAATTNVSTSFTIPESAGGTHTIYLRDVTANTYSAAFAFSITPTVVANPTSAAPGSNVTITGTGFAAMETGISVTWDGVAVQSAVTATATGAWASTFAVPESASGVTHAVDAFGPITVAAMVTDVNFNVTPVVSINPASGGVGAQATVPTNSW